MTTAQQAAIEAEASSFLLGPAGTGKTTALQQRLVRLLAAGEPAYTLLVVVAEPDHAGPYFDAIHGSGLGPYSDLVIMTYNQLAREMVTLFWPLVARPAGFARAYQPPTFLGYDLAQILMQQTIQPLLAEGAFADVRLRPQQIISQLLDTLNRAALNGLTLDEAEFRQISAWAGEPEHLRHLHEAAIAARQFRETCLANNLLDLSLVVQVFDTRLVRHPEFHRYFSERYRHLLVDNVEEQTPAGQNFVANLMDATTTTTIAYDAGGGYKRFLAADPTGANQFHDRCQHIVDFDRSFITTQALVHLSNQVENILMGTHMPTALASEAIAGVIGGRYRHEMVGNLIETLDKRLADVSPNEIAIIVPYLDGALRYSLTTQMKEAGIPYSLSRRRYSPRDEPRVRAWLTWLAAAHPAWEVRPTNYDVAEALTLSIADCDAARAQLIADSLYDSKGPVLLPASDLPERLQQRIGSPLLERWDELRLWLAREGGDRHPIDVFLHRLFHNLLAQPRFQPQPDLAGAAVCDWLVQSANRLRESAAPMGLGAPGEAGRALLQGVYEGLVATNPPDLGEPPDPNGVMISTIYGYLLGGRPVHFQVWLETAATGWWDIPRQPLSNAFVLAQSWRPERQWTMEEEFKIRNQLLSRLIRGLTNRCSGGIILATSDLDRRGIRQDGPLWRALQPLLAPNR
jgi:hypothetical protein